MAPKYLRALNGSWLLVALAVLTACSSKPSPPPAAPAPATPIGVKVTAITVGRSLAPDRTIADKTESFKPADTFYVSIATEGSATSTTLGARWTSQDGRVIGESKQNIAPTGAAVTEFHVSRP